MLEAKNIKLSILIPTNGKRLDITRKVFAALDLQTYAHFSELILVSEGDSVLNKINYTFLSLTASEILVPKGNGVLLNHAAGCKYAKGDYLLLYDDDMLPESESLIETLYDFMELHKNVWAVGPFINELKGTSVALKNRTYEFYKKLFKLWDPDDYTNKIYSCYGKGSANYKDNLPTAAFIGCSWLTITALLIRKQVFSNYYGEDLPVLNKVQPTQKLKAIDFYLTYRLYLKKKDALAFLPTVSVLHMAVDNTALNKFDNVERETICGFYYYKRFLRDQDLLTSYVLPNVGKFLLTLYKNVTKPKEFIYYIYLYLKSIIVFVTKYNVLSTIPVYCDDLKIEAGENISKVIVYNSSE